jgi:hypothetical protein
LCDPQIADVAIKSFVFAIALSMTIFEFLIMYVCRHKPDKVLSPVEKWSKSKVGNPWVIKYFIYAIFLIWGVVGKNPSTLVIFICILAAPQLLATLRRTVA